jgi:acyl-CoA dehydrogenase
VSAVRDELQATVRSLLAQRSASGQVRAAGAEPAVFDRGLWDQMVELGWTSIHIGEVHGGAGCGYADLAVVLHELGRALTPAPFLASAVLASGALARAENEALAAELLPAFTGGELLGSVALAGVDGSYDLARLTTSWRSIPGSLRLDGTAGFVPDADLADALVVAARDEDGALAVLALDPSAPGVSIEQVPTVDATRRLFTVAFDDVALAEDRLVCEPGAAAEALAEQVLALGVVAATADAVGVADAALEATAEYAKERMQFGKPIGSFQAVKHHCADMAIAVEAGRAAVRGAAEALDGDPPGWPTVAAITSSYVGPACSEACARSVRVFGGIGFTWEHDAHLRLERAKLDEVLFGTPSWHRRRLADAAFPALVAS